MPPKPPTLDYEKMIPVARPTPWRWSAHVIVTLVTLGLLLTVAGCCGLSQRAEDPPLQQPSLPSNWTATLSPELVRNWSPEEAKAVLVALASEQQSSKQAGSPPPDIRMFKVTTTPAGWEVYV